MSNAIAKAVALAERISARAEDTLSGIEREMRIMKWPNEFRVIMWEAVADAALARVGAIKSATPATEHTATARGSDNG